MRSPRCQFFRRLASPRHGAHESGRNQRSHRLRTPSSHPRTKRPSRLDRPLPDVRPRRQHPRSRSRQTKCHHPRNRRQSGQNPVGFDRRANRATPFTSLTTIHYLGTNQFQNSDFKIQNLIPNVQNILHYHRH